MNYEESIKSVIEICQASETLVLGDEIDAAQRELQGHLMYLETCRVHYHNEYNDVLHALINDKMSVNKAEIYAKKAVPQLYELRRIITRADKVSEVLRSTLSGLKTEFLNQNK